MIVVAERYLKSKSSCSPDRRSSRRAAAAPPPSSTSRLFLADTSSVELSTTRLVATDERTHGSPLRSLSPSLRESAVAWSWCLSIGAEVSGERRGAAPDAQWAARYSPAPPPAPLRLLPAPRSRDRTKRVRRRVRSLLEETLLRLPTRALSPRPERAPRAPPRTPLCHTMLQDADALLTDAVVTDTVLTDAVLTDVVITDAVLTDAVVTDAVVTDTVITDAVITDAVITDAVVTAAVATDAAVVDAAVGTTSPHSSGSEHIVNVQKDEEDAARAAEGWRRGARALRDAHVRLALRQLRHVARLNRALDALHPL